MNRLHYILTTLLLVLSSCVKHTEIFYEAIDFKNSYWLAYEVDGKKIGEIEPFIFYFTENKYLNILLHNPDNNNFETQYTFFYTDVKDNNAIIGGYFLSSYEYKEATLYYKKLDSEANDIEFKFRLSPYSEEHIIKMSKLKEEA